ncbi:MAG: GNAT family N-acetyltransferase [Bacteroidetes bacterium]|nr:GNAT family N-acetyltransferase [Bacteroidota bacterium]
MLVLNFSPFPTIITERLILRKVTENDVNEIFFLRSDKQVMKYIDRPSAQSIEDVFLYIQKIANLQNHNESITWGISLKNDPKIIGYLGFWNIKKEHFRSEIGYILHPNHHKKGIMQEALTAILDHGFKVFKFHSVEANVNPLNSSSIKLLERNNFKREAYFKEDYFFEGKFLDSAIYSLLTPEE